jgi:hypothetical protein
MARPRKYASDAERQKAYRERWAIAQFRLEKETAETIKRLAEFTDASESEVADSLIKFALLNRNWFTLGLFGKRLPRANPEGLDDA